MLLLMQFAAERHHIRPIIAPGASRFRMADLHGRSTGVDRKCEKLSIPQPQDTLGLIAQMPEEQAGLLAHPLGICGVAPLAEGFRSFPGLQPLRAMGERLAPLEG